MYNVIKERGISMKIKLSKSQWEEAGKKAGWIKTGQSMFTGYEQKQPPSKIYKGIKVFLIAYRDNGNHPSVIEYEIGSGVGTGPAPNEKDYHPLRGGVRSIAFSIEQEARDYIRQQLKDPEYKEVPLDILYATIEYYNKKNKVPSRL